MEMGNFYYPMSYYILGISLSTIGVLSPSKKLWEEKWHLFYKWENWSTMCLNF